MIKSMNYNSAKEIMNLKDSGGFRRTLREGYLRLLAHVSRCTVLPLIKSAAKGAQF